MFRTRLGAAALLSSVSVFACAQAATAQDASPAKVREVVVTAPREEVKARQVQLEAPNLVAVLSAETIAKYPAFNAAEALGRMPAVSILTDTGEGRFVNIRGLDGNLNGATFGGVPLLNTNPGGTYNGGGGRAVEFDTLPTGSIDGIVITYTGLPDHDAEGIGGTVELTPRTAANITKPFVEATLGAGYEPAHGHAGPFNGDLAAGARFGAFALVLTGSLRTDQRGFDDLEEDYTDPTAGRGYDDLQLRRYDYHRRRFGYGGEFDFRPSDDHRYYLRANIAGYRESVKKNRLTYDFSGYTPPTADPAHSGGFTTLADLSLASTDEEETHRNQVFVAGGRDVFGDNVVLDYRASYSRATFDVSKNYGAKFKGPQGVAVAYDNSGDNGDFPALAITDATNPNDASLYKLSGNKVGNSQENDVDREFAYAANLEFPLHLINDSDTVKTGGQLRFRNKTSSPFSQSIAVGPLNLSAASNPAITDFYDGHYSNGPNVDIAKIRALAGPSSGGFDPTAYFAARERIYAGYAQYKTRIGKWGLLAGVRVETTDALYSAYSDDNATATLALVARPERYTNVFPTVQVRYDFTPVMLVRATYSTGIGRPGFLQNSAITSSNHDPSDPQITTGNPGLKPVTANNFDVSFEVYLPRGGIVQLGAFDKQFDNYIINRFERKAYVGADPAFIGANVGYTTFDNVSSAYARGIEAAYHQQFLWLPKPFDGFGVEGNATLVDSRVQEYDALTSATGQAEYGALPGTSHIAGNLAAFYEAYGIQARVSGEYVGKQLYTLGGSKALDQFEDRRVTLDFTSSYAFTPNWKVYFNVKNLTNAPLRIYVGNVSLPIQREFYDQSFEAGVTARF